MLARFLLLGLAVLLWNVPLIYAEDQALPAGYVAPEPTAEEVAAAAAAAAYGTPKPVFDQPVNASADTALPPEGEAPASVTGVATRSMEEAGNDPAAYTGSQPGVDEVAVPVVEGESQPSPVNAVTGPVDAVVAQPTADEDTDEAPMSRVVDTGLRVYLAVAKGSPQYCKTEECQDDVPSALIARYVGEMACDKIEDEALKNVCLAVKNRNCAGLTAEGAERETCQLLFSENLSDVAGVVTAWRTARPDVTTDQVALMLGIASGYYRYSIKKCQAYLDAFPSTAKPYQSLFACEIIFAPDPEKVFEGFEHDAQIFEEARKGQPELCQQIVSPKLKGLCMKR